MILTVKYDSLILFFLVLVHTVAYATPNESNTLEAIAPSWSSVSWDQSIRLSSAYSQYLRSDQKKEKESKIAKIPDGDVDLTPKDDPKSKNKISTTQPEQKLDEKNDQQDLNTQDLNTQDLNTQDLNTQDLNTQDLNTQDDLTLTEPIDVSDDSEESSEEEEEEESSEDDQQGEEELEAKIVEIEDQTFDGKVTKDTCISYHWSKQVSGFIKNCPALESNEKLKTRPGRNFGTPEMLKAISDAVSLVHEAFPNTPPLVIGDLSKSSGGHFPPHRSHQTGRDADIGYYVRNAAPQNLVKVGPRDLDVPRTWTFMESLLKKNQVIYLFVDYSLQPPLYKYAKDVAGVPEHLLRKYFAYPKGRRAKSGIIQHWRGHANHIHARFHAPRTTAATTAYFKEFGTKNLNPIPVYHTIRKGETIAKIIKAYRIPWSKLKEMNRLTETKAKRLRIGSRIMVGYRAPRIP
jgi:hypothetical protein